MAIGIAVIVAVPLGVLGAYKQAKWQDSTTSALAQVALSIPNFIIGIFLIWLFAVRWNLLPASNWNRLSDGVGANLQTAILPAIALALGTMAVFSRLIRSDMIATLKEDYILSARSKGLERPVHPVPARAASEFAQPDDHRRASASVPCSVAPS